MYPLDQVFSSNWWYQCKNYLEIIEVRSRLGWWMAFLAFPNFFFWEHIKFKVVLEQAAEVGAKLIS